MCYQLYLLRFQIKLICSIYTYKGSYIAKFYGVSEHRFEVLLKFKFFFYNYKPKYNCLSIKQQFTCGF